jgi:hypothetical protein
MANSQVQGNKNLGSSVRKATVLGMYPWVANPGLVVCVLLSYDGVPNSINLLFFYSLIIF